MARTAAQNRTRKNACYDYRLATPDGCEVTRYLTDDRDAIKWMSNSTLPGYEIHHILGRGREPKFEYWCNLIQASRPFHKWLHDVSPSEGELACYWAKYQRHLDQIASRKAAKMLPISDESRLFWNPTVMSELTEQNGLAGRISYLLWKVDAGSIYAKFGNELLKVLGDSQ